MKVDTSNTMNVLRNVPKYRNPDKSFEELFEEKKQEDKDAKTESDIVVKPDGSRVLVLTSKIGGMESVVSIKISEPTDFPNQPAAEESLHEE